MFSLAVACVVKNGPLPGPLQAGGRSRLEMRTRPRGWQDESRHELTPKPFWLTAQTAHSVDTGLGKGAGKPNNRGAKELSPREAETPEPQQHLHPQVRKA